MKHAQQRLIGRRIHQGFFCTGNIITFLRKPSEEVDLILPVSGAEKLGTSSQEKIKPQLQILLCNFGLIAPTANVYTKACWRSMGNRYRGNASNCFSGRLKFLKDWLIPGSVGIYIQ